MAGFDARRLISAAVLLLLLMAPIAHSWGKEGHFVICKIAQENWKLRRRSAYHGNGGFRRQGVGTPKFGRRAAVRSS
ncbi:hypothetical protein DM860_005256 [Cuscuta australis]|uniref:Uncharacterized protein n=1 Tax=Cuscuta australis TaxID=267555 RepID=A0A328E0B3_9ASTE|nr:hypothetical protein DM860_005256 [Cuscuta australis]